MGDFEPHPDAIANAAIGREVIEFVNKGSSDDGPLWDRHWHPDFVSVEGDGQEFKGREAVRQKQLGWYDTVTMHSCVADGPWVTPGGFCVRYTIDVESKDGTWPRMKMEEIAVYTVENGKVVREEFFGPPMG